MVGLTKGEKILCVFVILLLVGLGLVGKTFMDLSAQTRAEREQYEKQLSELSLELQQTEVSLNQSKAQIQSLQQLEIMEHYNLTIILWFKPNILWFKPNNYSRLQIENVTLRVHYGPITTDPELLTLFSESINNAENNQSLVFDLSKQKPISLYQNDNETVLFSVVITSYCLKSFTDSGTASIGIFPICILSYQESRWFGGGNGMIQGEVGEIFEESKESMLVSKDTVWYVEL
jgi:hypothetical protein